MNFIEWLKDLFLGTFISLGKYFAEFYNQALAAGLDPNWKSIIYYMLAITFVFGSAFFAATIAEMKQQNRAIHFIGGLLIPYIYPIFIYLGTQKKGRPSITVVKDKEEQSTISNQAPKPKLKFADEEEFEDGAPVISQAYLRRIATDDVGKSRGPFIFVLEGGKVIEAARIIEALPQHVVIEIHEKDSSKTLRFPYSKIAAVVRKEEWDPNKIPIMKTESTVSSSHIIENHENKGRLDIEPPLLSKLRDLAKQEQKGKSNPEETAKFSLETMSQSTHIGTYVLLKPGTEIAGCKILSEIGRGGMGMVYLAKHTRLDINVALKVISARVQDENDLKMTKRFLQEAKIAAKIRHPHIVTVMDAGKDETNELFYIVMEYMDGGNVRDLIRKHGRLNQLDALKIALAVTDALAAGQKYDIVHRDIKPDNIMLSSDGEIKLSDLGLAKINEPLMELQLTGVNMVMGSIPYMSPEQAKDFTKADFRSDVYSLGVTLFHMLTGRYPYNAENPLALIMKAINDPIPNPKDIYDDIDDEVAALCMKMMGKKPEDRFQTPQELLEIIENLIEKLSQ